MATNAGAASPKKLHGRAFYESIGSPKYVVAPMVDQSEFAWRMLTRSFLPSDQRILAYSPMLHARLFAQDEKYRNAHFQAVKDSEPWLDGNAAIDRPLFVQFCANDPAILLEAARLVVPHCDAVDLNLGCPQGIARKGHYGAFLQEDQDLIFRMINILHTELEIPVTAKIRILDTKEKTLEYAQNVLKAGASIITVHGRRREQKGHHTGVADWEMLRFLRESLPAGTVMFANGNILQEGDLQRCLDVTGADGVMSAEGNLSDPALFAKPPPVGEEGREFWRGRDGRCGWRVDAVMRRYLDILHKYADGVEPPARRPLFMPGDEVDWTEPEDDGEPRAKRRKQERQQKSPNFSAIQPHLFHLLRHLVSKHTDVRDMLARGRSGAGMDGYEKILRAVEKKVAQGLTEYAATDGKSFEEELAKIGGDDADVPEGESSAGTIKKCKRPWWVAQPIVRPLPAEAVANGAITLSKKDAAKAKADNEKTEKEETKSEKKVAKSIEAQETMAEKPGTEKVDAKSSSTEEAAKQAKGRIEDIEARDQLVSG